MTSQAQLRMTDKGLRTVKGQECEGKLDARKDTEEEEMEHAKGLKDLDPLLSGTNRRHWCLTIIVYVSITDNVIFLPVLSVVTRTAIALFRILLRAEPFPPRLGQCECEESGLRHEQHQREDRRSGINVELGAKQGLSEGHRSGGEVRANRRPDAEAYCECDAHMREGLCAVGGSGDVREDCAFCRSEPGCRRSL